MSIELEGAQSRDDAEIVEVHSAATAAHSLAALAASGCDRFNLAIVTTCWPRREVVAKLSELTRCYGAIQAQLPERCGDLLHAALVGGRRRGAISSPWPSNSRGGEWSGLSSSLPGAGAPLKAGTRDRAAKVRTRRCVAMPTFVVSAPCCAERSEAASGLWIGSARAPSRQAAFRGSACSDFAGVLALLLYARRCARAVCTLGEPCADRAIEVVSCRLELLGCQRA